MSREVVLVGARRTAIGKFGDALASVSVADLGAIVIKEALRRAAVSAEKMDEANMGCVIQVAQWPNVARQAAAKAGLPVEVPAQTLNIDAGQGCNASIWLRR